MQYIKCYTKNKINVHGNPIYVQELKPDDCDRRMEHGELMLSWHGDWPELFENIL